MQVEPELQVDGVRARVGRLAHRAPLTGERAVRGHALTARCEWRP